MKQKATAATVWYLYVVGILGIFWLMYKVAVFVTDSVATEHIGQDYLLQQQRALEREVEVLKRQIGEK